MKNAPIPANEKERLAALQASNVLDTPIQEAFERVTRLAKKVFGVPMAVFSLIDSERQWIKSAQGLDICETSRDTSFCGHTINEADILIICDTKEDARFCDNPFVLGNPHVRFYAGCPVKNKSGLALGSLCIIDHAPRTLSESDILALKDMAELIQDELEANKARFEQYRLLGELSQAKNAAITDPLTRLLNRHGIEILLNQKMADAITQKQRFGIAFIDIDNFKKINDHYGHPAGDEVLRVVAKRLLMGYRDVDWVGRFGGEEFLSIVTLENGDDLRTIAEHARALVASEPVDVDGQSIPVSITTGITCFDPNHPEAIPTLIKHADDALYKGKQSGKNCVLSYTQPDQQ